MGLPWDRCPPCLPILETLESEGQPIHLMVWPPPYPGLPLDGGKEAEEKIGKRQIWDRFNVASQIYSDIVWTLLLSVMTTRARAMIKKKKAADLSEPQSEASIEYPTHHFID